MSDILAVDIGTSILKLGVFSSDLTKKCESSRRYDINLYDHGKADIEPEIWWNALVECCHDVANQLGDVDTVSFSVTTPGLTGMDGNGKALTPAILFLDARSNEQAKEIRAKVGEDKFLRETCNLPVSGGSSLCSILWIKENQPEIYDKVSKFGHCNTYIVKRLTGKWAIDPSTVSITGLYNTARHDLDWNYDILDIAGISADKLPPLFQSYQVVGTILADIASTLGLPENCAVLCGGNDAVLAALAGGTVGAGNIGYSAGTCEITYVCTDSPLSSPNYNVRCHVIPDRWLTFFVLNTGGKSLDWFHSVFCQEMSLSDFYEEYIPDILNSFLTDENVNDIDISLPEYIPYLQGSRYSIEKMTAGFSRLSLETKREDFLLALLKGNARYQGEHLNEVAQRIKLDKKIYTSGGMAGIKGFLEVKKRWSGPYEYENQDQSSLLGAAMLGVFYITGKYN